jgi:uncharacterized protein YbaR (Trm112 family)
MKRSTLELLCCPNCQVALSLRDERGDLTVDEGNLFCSHCEQSFIIKNGVARFIDPQELEGINRRFARSYNWFSAVYALFTKVAFLPVGGERNAPSLPLNSMLPNEQDEILLRMTYALDDYLS